MAWRNPTVTVDLHCHSDRSDGYHSPEDLVNTLARAGVQYAALTDHQSVAGIPGFRAAATRKGIAHIVGAEVSASYQDLEIHLLVYSFDPQNTIMEGLLRRSVTAAETIAAVHEAGGIVVMAHPLTTVPDRDRLESVVEGLTDRGLDGIEAIYKAYSEEDQEFLLELADRLGLVVTGGSDYHGLPRTGAVQPGISMPRDRWKRFRDALGSSGGSSDSGTGTGTGTDTATGTDRGATRRTFPRESPPSDSPPSDWRPRNGDTVNWRWLLARIILPSFLVVLFFVTLLFAVLIPTVEELLLDRKRETTAELTNSAWSILADYERAVRDGSIPLPEAQDAAIERIRRLRYGPEQLDYFWLTDMHPRMIMHPYRPELEGSDLTGFTDPDGVRPFVEFVQAVQDRSSGYVRYVWQWQDDPERLEAKESYVRGFEPWGWVIGTGLYVDDVEREITAITRRMIDASVIVTILAGVLLLVIARQSLKLERRRSEAERELHLSHERYRLLVESSTAGTLLLLDGRCTYANKPMLEMLGYDVSELALMDLEDILAEPGADSDPAMLRRVAEGAEVRDPFEVLLKPRRGAPERALVSSAPVYFSGRKGVILTIQDLSHHEAMRTALGESRAKYETLAQNIPSGVIRFSLDGEMPILEMNHAAERIFDVPPEPATPFTFAQFCFPPENRALFLQRLRTDQSVRDMVIQIRRHHGELRTVRVSAVLSENGTSPGSVCDAIMEDISERRRTEAQRETLISQLQTSLLFLTGQVRNSMNHAVSCSLETPVAAAVRLMGRHDVEAVVVTGSGGEPIGIVTDHDIRARVVAPEADTRIPVSRIMSAPVITISETAPVFEAFLLERDHDVDHLVVTDSAGVLSGIVRSSRTVRLDQYSPVVLLRQIERAMSVDDLADCHDKVPVLVGSLIESGAASENVCHVTTAISDAITQRTITLALEELGPPPVPFAFVALGSAAREEQTLATDQDNAIIYGGDPDTVTDPDTDTEAYFLRLGSLVCEGLHHAGYPRCPGEAMARDRRWNKPLTDWKASFTEWIAEPHGTALAHCNVFFDVRCIHGDRSLVRSLRRHVDQEMDRNPAFFSHMAINTLQYKPPIGVFGQIVTGTTGSSINTFDIKAAMLPLVNFARLYALRHHLSETNTFDRLEQLHALDVLGEENYRGTVQAYDHLMQLRYRHQIARIRAGQEPDNMIDPRSLTQIESGTVKTALARIAAIQKKVSYDFRGG